MILDFFFIKMSKVFLFLLLVLKYEFILGQNRIIGGQNGQISRLPFMVYIEAEGGVLVCSGSIIGTKWGLSAAHCFQEVGSDFTLRDYLVTSGEANVRSRNPPKSREVHKIDKIYIHEKYAVKSDEDVAAAKGYDIAVFRVIEPFPSNVNIKLPTTKDDLKGSLARAAGWGCTKAGGTASNLLKYVWVRKISDDACASRYRKVIAKNSVICYARLAESKNPGNPGNTCKGDSGGPLFTNNGIVIGIMSMLDLKGQGPSLFTNVLFYRKWIKGKTGI